MTAITTAARLLRVAADELKNAHTLGGDWGNEHEALDAYNEHMATATTLEHMGRQCLAQIEEPAGAAPAAVAGPVLDVTLDEDQAGLLRDMLGDHAEYPEAITVRLMVGDGHSGLGLYVAQAEYQDEGAVLLASLPAPAAPALEAPAAPAGDLALIIAALEHGQPQMAHYAEPCERHAKALAATRRMAAAPQAPAAPAVDALAPVQALLDVHAELLDANPYAYFELAYTRQTGWMAWITDKPMHGPVVNPDRKVLARGQGGTPAEACKAAAQAKEGGA